MDEGRRYDNGINFFINIDIQDRRKEHWKIKLLKLKMNVIHWRNGHWPLWLPSVQQ